jgi:hypothetical protein
MKLSLKHAVEAHGVVRRRDAHILLENSFKMVVATAIHAGRPLPSSKFLSNFRYRLKRPQGHSAASKNGSTEKSNNLIGNRTS